MLRTPRYKKVSSLSPRRMLYPTTFFICYSRRQNFVIKWSQWGWKSVPLLIGLNGYRSFTFSTTTVIILWPAQCVTTSKRKIYIAPYSISSDFYSFISEVTKSFWCIMYTWCLDLTSQKCFDLLLVNDIWTQKWWIRSISLYLLNDLLK